MILLDGTTGTGRREDIDTVDNGSNWEDKQIKEVSKIDTVLCAGERYVSVTRRGLEHVGKT